MQPTLTQPVNKSPAWLNLPLTKEFRNHIKSVAAQRGQSSKGLVIQAIVQSVGIPTVEPERRKK